MKEVPGAPPHAPYLSLFHSGELTERVANALARLHACRLCPHACGANRAGGERGVCRTGATIALGAAVPHFGEEPVLAGDGPVGNLFVSGCSLRCRYCQNYELSHEGLGKPQGADDIARAMLRLQAAGCRFIGWVSPAHAVPQLLAGLLRAVERGFARPLIYNSSGWEDAATLALLDGVISVYLPDLKYAGDAVARRLSGCSGYVETARRATVAMYRQVGDLRLDADGLAEGGLVVRHLVLPNDLAGSWESLSFLRIELGRRIGLSLLSQYAPTPRVMADADLCRGVTEAEYDRVVEMALDLGFLHLFGQDREARKIGLPRFRRKVPFVWPEKKKGGAACAPPQNDSRENRARGAVT